MDTGSSLPTPAFDVLPSLACDTPSLRTTIGPFSKLDAGDWGSQAVDAGPGHFILSSGIGVGDLNDDGWNDIVIPRRTGLDLYLSDGAGGLVRSPMPPVAHDAVGVSVVDYDGDGDLDLYLSQYNGYPDALLENNGRARFTNATAGSGIGVHAYGVGSSWADVDGDGDLDLLALNHGNWIDTRSESSYLYENLGEGRFTRVEDAFPSMSGYGHTLAGGFLDLNLDGLPEVYLVNDYGWILPNWLLINDGDRLRVADPAFGLTLRICGMGMAETDLNDDGVPDLFLSSWEELRLLKSSPLGWVDHTAAAGLQTQTELGRYVAWGADFGDIDNDGDDDLFVGFGGINANLDNPSSQPDALYLQDGEGNFIEVAESWRIADSARTRGAVLVDVDGDGWLDLIKRNKGQPAVYRPARCGERAWLGVQLRDEGPNTRAVGARIRVIDEGFQELRVVRAGGRSLASGGSPEVHFGLGDLQAVSLEITWPDGEVQRIEQIETRQRIRVRR